MTSISITRDSLDAKFSQNYFSLDNYVFYVENEESTIVTSYIRENLDSIKQQFENRNKRFVFVPDLSFNKDINNVLEFTVPSISKTKLAVFSLLNLFVGSENINSYLLSYIGYKGNLKSGFISINDYDITITDRFNLSSVDINTAIDYYISGFHILDDYDQLPATFDAFYDENIKLDDETKEKVDNILDNLYALKESGQFLHALPIIEKFIAQSEVKPTTHLSKLFIDNLYNIYLADYNNMHIKLSHLTLSVYHLFLNHPKGILLENIQQYEYSLMNYYKSISNREDFDKMSKSIQDIVNLETGALYTHLSRIKSAFSKKLHPRIAEQYYVVGGKGLEKKILLDRVLLEREDKSYDDFEEPIDD